jgi:enamine deaminase RidA (YjgF/YER057c/UK114 family)
MAGQIETCLDNIETVLEAAGMTLANVVRLTTYTTDLAAFAEHRGASLDRLRAAGSQHVSTLLGVAGLAMPELLVEMEATAVA